MPWRGKRSDKTSAIQGERKETKFKNKIFMQELRHKQKYILQACNKNESTRLKRSKNPK